jgi:hypothetical protein
LRVSLEEDPTPMAAALANDLERCLEDPEFAAATERLRGLACVRDADTPQAVTVRIAAEQVSLAHGLAEGAHATAILGSPAGAIEGRGEHPDLAAWLERLLDPPEPPWEEAAERFWSVLANKPGAPDGLRVVNLDTGEERGFGAEDGSTYEIHGSARGLTEVLTGRARLIEAAYEGSVFVHGSFPQLSVLTGAGFELRYGRGSADG